PGERIEGEHAERRVEVGGRGGEPRPPGLRPAPRLGERPRREIDRHRTPRTGSTASAPRMVTRPASRKSPTNPANAATIHAPSSGDTACGTVVAMFITPRSFPRVAGS